VLDRAASIIAAEQLAPPRMNAQRQQAHDGGARGHAGDGPIGGIGARWRFAF
jgi:hypothetical protein